MLDARSSAAAAYLETDFQAKGIGGWRQLYLSFIRQLRPTAVAELGAGAPEFLGRIMAERRIAVDIGQRYAEAFRSRNIEFSCRDLERDDLQDLGPVDVAICSDVFEHLVDPSAALDRIMAMMGPHGILFSHVPNEYRLSHMINVMLSRRNTVLFHKAATEWADPHVRRFSDIGYRSFLERRFKYNLRLSDLRYGRPARMLNIIGAPVPYCLQGGPTYASTNDPGMLALLVELKRKIGRARS